MHFWLWNLINYFGGRRGGIWNIPAYSKFCPQLYPLILLYFMQIYIEKLRDSVVSTWHCSSASCTVCTGVYLYRAQQGVFPSPKEVLSALPPNKIYEISQLNAYSSCFNCTPYGFIIISPGLIMLKCYLGAFMGTLILIYALASCALRGRGHIPLPHPPPWAAKAAHYFNFSHVPPP